MTEKTIEGLYEENKRLIEEIEAAGNEMMSLIYMGSVAMVFGFDATEVKKISGRVEKIQALIDEKCKQAEKNSEIAARLLAEADNSVS